MALKTTDAAVTLIVAEKPSVARDLARTLGAHRRMDGAFGGDGLWVTWCLGHVAELEEPQAYNPAWKRWHAAHLPMLPDHFALRPAKHASDHWRRLKALLRHKSVCELVNACDAGREGELIFRFAIELAEVKKPCRRLWLTAMTETGIRHAYARLKPAHEFDHLGDAARCRAEADWLMGLNATRALTLAVRRRDKSRELLTVGRVQTPTLAMLVARDDAIASFVPEPFCLVEAEIKGEQNLFSARYHPDKKSSSPSQKQEQNADPRRLPERIFDLEKAHRVAEEAKKTQTATVTCVEHRDDIEPPPYLYDLTALQRRANARFKMSAQATLDATQALYEQHKAVTYPRTDSNFLPSQLAPSLRALVKKLCHGTLGSEAQRVMETMDLQQQRVDLSRIVRDAEVSDHHAIIPTGTLPRGKLSSDQQNIYGLIVRRFLAAFMPPAITARTTLTLNLHGLVFVARGRSTRQIGWHAIEPPPRDKSAPASLPSVKKDDPLPVKNVRILQRKTEAPPRLTEASLLGQMERPGGRVTEGDARLALKAAGLGTPATRATIIENLKRRGFAETQGHALKASDAGRKLLREIAGTTLVSPELTGMWEAKLTRVANGSLSRQMFMQEVRALVEKTTLQISQPR